MFVFARHLVARHDGDPKLYRTGRNPVLRGLSYPLDDRNESPPSAKGLPCLNKEVKQARKCFAKSIYVWCARLGSMRGQVGFERVYKRHGLASYSCGDTADLRVCWLLLAPRSSSFDEVSNSQTSKAKTTKSKKLGHSVISRLTPAGVRNSLGAQVLIAVSASSSPWGEVGCFPEIRMPARRPIRPVEQPFGR